MEQTERTGEIVCPEHLIDSFGHVYNGFYTELVRLLLIKEDLLVLIESYLKIYDFSFERFLRRETIKFKKEITCHKPINYKIEVKPSNQKVRIFCKLYVANAIEATQIELSFGNKQKCQTKPGKEWVLVGKERLLHPIFPDYKRGLLSIQIYKSLFEVARGRFLSLALQGDQNYFGMLSTQNIAFISSSSTVKYYQEIKLGEFFEIKTYRKPEKETLRIAFFQDLINMNKEVVARITTEIVQIDVVKKRPQATNFRSQRVQNIRRIFKPIINFGEKRIKGFEKKIKPIKIKLKRFSSKKKKPRKAQGISLGLSHKRACISAYLSLQLKQYLLYVLFSMPIISATFVKSASKLSECPESDLPEFALIGRSNVGKSTLINMLTQQKKLAKASVTPGKTQLLNYFLINKARHLVDLPGYGYAKYSKTQRIQWMDTMQDYFMKRPNLRKVFVLVDGSLPPQKIDSEFMEVLQEDNIDFALIITKIDKVNQKDAHKYMEARKAEYNKVLKTIPEMFISSSIKGRGRNEIVSYIEGLLK